MFEIMRDNSVEEFLSKTKQLLYCDEPSYNLMLGLCEGMIANPPKEIPLLIRVSNNHETIAVAIQVPPMYLVITRAEQQALQDLAIYLKGSGLNPPGVVGPAVESEIFAKEWSQLCGKPYRLGMGQKIYKIEKVIFPEAIDGTFRVAGSEESKIVFEWVMAFAKESLPLADQRGESYWKDFAEKGIQKQTAHLWLQDNKPVSIAFTSRPTKNGITINGVYTPPAFRKKGFASAVVAHLSQKMLDAGKEFCVLYTDLSNPTSNKIYQDIGYQEVSDSKLFLF